MIIDGRAVAKKIEESLKERLSALRLKEMPKVSFLTFGEDPATKSFLSIKRKVAERIGVDLQIHELPMETLEEVAIGILESLVDSSANNGVVVQLPLPDNLDQDRFLNKISPLKDIDSLSPLTEEKYATGQKAFAPPVALAVEEILRSYDVSLLSKRIAVVGYGKLVGRPVSSWLKRQDLNFEIFDIGSDLDQLIEFDIIISGVGKAGLIKKEMVKEGAILIDAGASEVGGEIVGDIEREAYDKASLVSPVPGGVGPVTVVKLFENLLTSLESERNV